MIQYLYTWFFFSLSRMKYEWVCEHVVVVDACYTKKYPPTMCLSKKEEEKKAELFLHWWRANQQGGAQIWSKGVLLLQKGWQTSQFNEHADDNTCTFSQCFLVPARVFASFPFFMDSTNLSHSLSPQAGRCRIVHLLCVLFAQGIDSAVLYSDLNGVSFVCVPVPKKLRTLLVLDVGGGRVHAAQPVLRRHQETGVPRPRDSQELHEEICQGIVTCSVL